MICQRSNTTNQTEGAVSSPHRGRNTPLQNAPAESEVVDSAGNFSPKQLQNLWDRVVISTWYEGKMLFQAAREFENKTGVKPHASGLMRVGRRYDYKLPVRAWVSQKLPKLSAALLDTPFDDVLGRARIVQLLGKSKIDTKERREYTRSDVEFFAMKRDTKRTWSEIMICRKAVKDKYASQKPSGQWAVCK